MKVENGMTSPRVQPKFPFL